MGMFAHRKSLYYIIINVCVPVCVRAVHAWEYMCLVRGYKSKLKIRIGGQSTQHWQNFEHDLIYSLAKLKFNILIADWLTIDDFDPS